jgi:ParB-like chromosome segregation protein Spo0J/DNA modification methylase
MTELPSPTPLEINSADRGLLRAILPTIEISVDSVVVANRVRTDFGDIADLAESIQQNGLIQPIVVTSDHRLIAGERRLRAHRLLKWETIKAVYLEVIDDAHLTILEATENIVRQDFTWKEKVLAIDKVHRLKTTESALRSEAWGVRETGRLLRSGKSSISKATFIAAYLHANDQEILAAESIEDAYRIIVKRREDELSKALVGLSKPASATKLTQAHAKPKVERRDIDDADFFEATGTTGFIPGISSPVDLDELPGGESDARSGANVPLSTMFHHGDAVAICKTFAEGTFDAVITDWPYGIDMDNLSQDGGGKDVSSTAGEHGVEANKTLQSAIIPELYRILKPNSWFITWTDMSVYEENVRQATACGFKVQRWPLVWHKTSSCQNMSAQQNFTKNYEIALVCRKGTATLLRPQSSSVWSGGNDAETRLLGHPFAKPAALWEWIYNATCKRGDAVLDPFVGCGSSTIPAVRLGLRPTGIECVETHFNTLNVNLQNFYRTIDPTCTFS